MYYKKIIGKKCYLSPIDTNDYQKYTEWLNDLSVLEYLTLANINMTEDSEKKALENLSKEHNYAIIDIEKNELIGNCGLTHVDDINRTAEIGIFIGNKNYWGKGFGTEAVTLLSDFSFHYLNLNNILLRVFDYNERAIKSYLKAGFKIIGKRRNAIERKQKKYDVIYMDLIPDELKKQ
ncbi:MAG: GNAT family N-acetyltransferase [Spirochaetales bacterium]|nr:GNAT family N-acetyltransferase [Spirochaetales bacterium]